MFQDGIFPSGSDYRIYRDYGKIPGFDITHILDSYRYHSKFDNIEGINKEALQNTGDNILTLTRVLGNAEELFNTTVR